MTREPLPRILPDCPDPAPCAAGLPDGTPHPDLSGWLVAGGVYVRASGGDDGEELAA